MSQRNSLNIFIETMNMMNRFLHINCNFHQIKFYYSMHIICTKLSNLLFLCCDAMKVAVRDELNTLFMQHHIDVSSHMEYNFFLILVLWVDAVEFTTLRTFIHVPHFSHSGVRHTHTHAQIPRELAFSQFQILQAKSHFIAIT